MALWSPHLCKIIENGLNKSSPNIETYSSLLYIFREANGDKSDLGQDAVAAYSWFASIASSWISSAEPGAAASSTKNVPFASGFILLFERQQQP
jgi:hypothetical protein